MSDSIFDDELENEGLEPESDELGMTSDESPTDEAEGAGAGAESADQSEQESKFKFSVFDAMLLVSLICITLATILLVFELRTFGDFPFSFPWRTSEA